LEGIQHLVYIHLMIEVEVGHPLEYKMADMLYHVASMNHHQTHRLKVLDLNSSPDLKNMFWIVII
jgi:hypothetical protein